MNIQFKIEGHAQAHAVYGFPRRDCAAISILEFVGLHIGEPPVDVPFPIFALIPLARDGAGV